VYVKDDYKSIIMCLRSMVASLETIQVVESRQALSWHDEHGNGMRKALEDRSRSKPQW